MTDHVDQLSLSVVLVVEASEVCTSVTPCYDCLIKSSLLLLL